MVTKKQILKALKKAHLQVWFDDEDNAAEWLEQYSEALKDEYPNGTLIDLAIDAQAQSVEYASSTPASMADWKEFCEINEEFADPLIKIPGVQLFAGEEVIYVYVV